ncbi:OsmC family protein [Algoriphagus sp. D3-2-R+10]|uniref:OsmC family protein n=1 Tax=Algoriphagus aurantiacus TaxID=3103948 RepID=UPI002B3BAC6C|nr:OsmC family protein [Algoriphagus sp. D3-2-R+10]MEB2778157.1 OsmC family protein [Algoriphagus sp. D3-2-R+10]
MKESRYYNVGISRDDSHKDILCTPEKSEKNSVIFEVGTHPEYHKGNGEIWSPEHLFVAAISGCLETTFLAIAKNSKLEFTSFSCHAKIKLEIIEGKLMLSNIFLKPTVVLQNELFRNKTIRILKKAEYACLIIHSIKSSITMEIGIELNPI